MPLLGNIKYSFTLTLRINDSYEPSYPVQCAITAYFIDHANSFLYSKDSRGFSSRVFLLY